jgi:colanic acid biosynthesis glycosyl transferase WcaI
MRVKGVLGSSPRVTVVGLNYAPEETGIAPYTAGLSAGLAAFGWNVRVITSYPHYPAWKIADGYNGRVTFEHLDNVRVTRYRPYMPKNPSGVKRLLLELKFGISSVFSSWEQPDVVILVSPALFAAAIAQIRARLSPRRPLVVVWVQDLYTLGVRETGALGSVGARVMGFIESKVLQNADKVVVIHERFKRYVVSALRVQPDHVDVVRNWTHLIAQDVNRSAYRTKFGWGDETVVLHAGNMGAKQALESVVSAAALADRSGAPVRFVLLGNGNQRDKLISMSVGIERLEFLESLSNTDFQGAMAAADILLVNEKPGVVEMAVPSKLTSYYAARRPVIVASDADSITSEEIAASGAGIRVDAGEPALLLDAALSLGSNPELANTLGAHGADFQRRVLSREAAIAHYAEIINSLAANRVL